jgi:hypothetical protein
LRQNSNFSRKPPSTRWKTKQSRPAAFCSA